MLGLFVFFKTKSNTFSGLRRKLTNGLRVTEDMLRFLWRGSHLGERSSAPLYKTEQIERGPWNSFRSQERRRAPINALYNLSLRRDRKEHRWEFLFLLSNSQNVHIRFYSLMLYWNILTVSFSLSLSEAQTMKSAHSLAGLLLLIIIQSSWQVPDQDTDRNSM